MADIHKIPSFGFSRGAVVRLSGSNRNMLVVRDLGATTCCIVIEGDAGGTVRMREFSTDDLRQLRVDEGPIDAVIQERDELRRTMEERWLASGKGMIRWRKAHPDPFLVPPDQADLVVWLLDLLEAKEFVEEVQQAKVLLEEFDGWWAEYPASRRIKRSDAYSEYLLARLIVDASTLLKGLRSFQDFDAQLIPEPAVWLATRRWFNPQGEG